MYKYLLWDIDGTVLDFLASEAYAIKALFKKYRLGECSDSMVQTYSLINVKYWEALERNELTKPEVLIGRFLEFFDMMGIDKSIAEEFNREYQLALGDHLVFVKNAKEMLQKEKDRFVLVAVTNGTKVAQTKKMKQSGLEGVFNAVFISEDVGAEKPNREYFDYVFEKMGITDKRQVLLIGDSLTSDMKGGADFGIDTCWYNPKRLDNTKKVSITYEIDDLCKLEEILGQL